MTQCISKDYLMDHVVDALVDERYEEAVLLDDIYDAPVVETIEGEENNMTTVIAFVSGAIFGACFGIVMYAVLTAERWK